MDNKKKKKPFYKRWWFIGIVIFMIVGALGGGGDETDKEKDKPAINKEEGKKKDTVKKEDKVNLEITGDLNIEFKDNKAIATITTNAVDDSIFETSIIDADLNIVSDFLTIKDGKAIKEFEVSKDWEPGYLSGMAGMRFNFDDHPQTEEVKKVYGENGEKLKGKLAQANNKEGYNINLENKIAPYPDEATAKAKQDEAFNETMNELIKASGGVIVKVQPRFEENEWNTVAVTVGDAWYNSQEHEKERFADQVGETIATLVKNSGKVEGNKTVMVYFFDAYQKELASPKVTGGYKIKK